MEKNNLKVNSQAILEEKILNWNSVQQSFEKSFGTEIYTSWLKNINLLRDLKVEIWTLAHKKLTMFQNLN